MTEEELPTEKYETRSKAVFGQQDSEITKYLLEMESVIQMKLMYYKGYVFNKEKNTWVKVFEEKEQMMNDKGVHYANRAFRHFLYKGAALANLTADQVSRMIIPYASRVRSHLLQNLRNYAITSLATVDEVKNDISEMAFLNLTRSIDDKERGYISEGRKVVEHKQLTETPPDRKKLKIGW